MFYIFLGQDRTAQKLKNPQALTLTNAVVRSRDVTHTVADHIFTALKHTEMGRVHDDSLDQHQNDLAVKSLSGFTHHSERKKSP